MEPTEKDVNDPLFNAVWEAVKLWDISREPASRRLYAEINGTDIMTILCAVRPFVADAFSEGRKQGLREAVSIMKRHPEGEGEWCDTGEDMEWACRSECVERAVKRVEAAIEKEGE